MRHHQHKGLYIALKLGGAAVATAAATAAAYKAYVVLKEKSKQQEMLAEASLHHGESGRLSAFMHHERGDEAPLYPGRFSTGGSF